jgi:hypothetical protein
VTLDYSSHSNVRLQPLHSHDVGSPEYSIRVKQKWFPSRFPLSSARSRSAAVTLPRTGLSLPCTFIGLVCSRVELIHVRLKKVNYFFFYSSEPIKLKSWTLLWKSLSLSPGLPKQTQLLLRRLRICAYIFSHFEFNSFTAHGANCFLL